MLRGVADLWLREYAPDGGTPRSHVSYKNRRRVPTIVYARLLVSQEVPATTWSVLTSNYYKIIIYSDMAVLHNFTRFGVEKPLPRQIAHAQAAPVALASAGGPRVHL